MGKRETATGSFLPTGNFMPSASCALPVAWGFLHMRETTGNRQLATGNFVLSNNHAPLSPFRLAGVSSRWVSSSHRSIRPTHSRVPMPLWS